MSNDEYFGNELDQTWLDRIPIARRPPLSQAEASALGQAVNRAAKHVFGATCLTRSLLLRWLLLFYGTPSELRIGVRFANDEFAAHAWVEKDGIPLNERPEVVACYAAFDQPVSSKLFT